MRVGCSILLWCSLLPVLSWAAEGGLKLTTTTVVLDNHSDSNNNVADVPTPPLHSVPDANDSPETITRNFISATLGDNMVLQRDTPAVVWGYSEYPGATVQAALLRPTESFDSNTDEEDTVLSKVVHLATTTVEDDGTWRLSFPPQPASLTPQVIAVKATTGETGQLNNVLFGDVYICGGQSNMEFAMPAQTDGKDEAAQGDHYPHIRVFTVGKGTRSSTPLPDLQTITQTWSVAGSHSLLEPTGGWGYFSAVCWFFGNQESEGLGNQVPLGLISSNWGGTKW